ncbi:MAG: metallophosphoesterase [Clostridia bacterium]|nr:metallophosphoesterase [Clostridia bacterium]
MRKIISILLALCMMAGLLPVSAAEYTYAEPVEKDKWKDPDFSTDHAYSIAFVGDPQFINNSDVNFGEKKMEQLFGVIADTAEERKLKHVFVLGDITHVGYRNDSNLAARHVDPPATGEWENAQKAILQLSNAGVSYSLCRGNHDDYMMDDYFNIPAYTDQFKDCGGFFSDSNARYTGGMEPKNPHQYVYWSATTGYHENSIVNSYKTMEICGNKYIFITVDFNPTIKVVNWLNGILEEYSDHMAIVTTHAYINNMGQHLTYNDGTMIDHGISATQLWESCLKLHENVLMVVCGHVSCIKPLVSARKGVAGNTVREILVNPQGYDLNREVGPGTQDTGAVLYMNFSENGGKVTFDYYSTLMNKEYAVESYPMNLYKEKPLFLEEQEVDAKAEEEKKPDPVSSAPSSSEIQLQGQGGGIVVAIVGSAVAVAVIVVAVILVRKKK